jgi:hypothetical protein
MFRAGRRVLGGPRGAELRRQKPEERWRDERPEEGPGPEPERQAENHQPDRGVSDGSVWLESKEILEVGRHAADHEGRERHGKTQAAGEGLQRRGGGSMRGCERHGEVICAARGTSPNPIAAT